MKGQIFLWCMWLQIHLLPTKNLAVCLSKPCIPVWNRGAAAVQGSHPQTILRCSSPAGRGALRSPPQVPTEPAASQVSYLLSDQPEGSFFSSLSYKLRFAWITHVFSLPFPPYLAFCVDWVPVQHLFCWPHQPGSPRALPTSPVSSPTRTRLLRTSRDELQIENPHSESVHVSPEGLFIPMQMLCSGNDV